MDEVPTQAPDFVVSLSIALDSELTANLIDALRAARVNAVCPSKAAVRALNLCGGVNPSNPPHAVARRSAPRFRGGDGLRPAGLSDRERSLAVGQRFSRRNFGSHAPPIERT